MIMSTPRRQVWCDMGSFACVPGHVCSHQLGSGQKRASALDFFAVTVPGLVCIVTLHHWEHTKGKLPTSDSASSAKQCSWLLVSTSVPCAAAQDLSGAYTNLEAHCYQVEAEVRRLKEQLAEASAQVSAQAAADLPGERGGCVCWQRPLSTSPLHTMSRHDVGRQLGSAWPPPEHGSC